MNASLQNSLALIGRVLLALLGGLCALGALGAGKLSLDARRATL